MLFWVGPRWPGLYIHVLVSHWTWATGEGVWLLCVRQLSLCSYEVILEGPGSTAEGIPNNWGNKTFVERWSGWYITVCITLQSTSLLPVLISFLTQLICYCSSLQLYSSKYSQMLVPSSFCVTCSGKTSSLKWIQVIFPIPAPELLNIDRENQIIVRYHHTPVWMAIIKKTSVG